MARNLDKAVNALLAERKHLLNQVSAINQAVAILQGSNSSLLGDQSSQPSMTSEVGNPTITRLRPKRTLSRDHIAAMVEGRRKKRLAEAILAGQALEPVAEPMIMQSGNEPPRLVKRVAETSRAQPSGRQGLRADAESPDSGRINEDIWV